MLQYGAHQKAANKKRRKKKFTIDCYYWLISRFIVTFTTAMTIVEEVSFAMPWNKPQQSLSSPEILPMLTAGKLSVKVRDKKT